ncbi:MAG TPA: hypothetical protein VIC55_11400 [Gemmatimonadaceae bacterium]|jgi:hypothetical protein
MLMGIAAALAVIQLVTGSLALPDSAGAAPPLAPVDTDAVLTSARLGPANIVAADTTPPMSRRPQAIEHSDAYYTRLKIHRIGSYAMLPLFVTEYFLGQRLLNSTNRSPGLKSAHSIVAGGVAVVFAANTVTGAWNWWDDRPDPHNKTLRTVHSVIMLASDVGVLWTAAAGGGAKRSLTQARTHRAIAIGTISVSAVGTAMMWIWNR